MAGGRGILSGLLPSSGRGRGGLGKGSKGEGAAKLGGYGKNFSTPLRNPKIAKSKAQTLQMGSQLKAICFSAPPSSSLLPPFLCRPLLSKLLPSFRRNGPSSTAPSLGPAEDAQCNRVTLMAPYPNVKSRPSICFSCN